MPTILSNGTAPPDMQELKDRDYRYSYPNGLDLRPDSQLHRAIVSRLVRFAHESDTNMSNRRDDWNAIDEVLTAYIPTDEKEREIKRQDRRKPTSIVFPYSYAILETLLSYMVAAFFPEPMFRYEGNSPEDIVGASLLEKVISLHCNRNKIALNLHTFFRDAGAYGFGAVAPQWSVQRGTKYVRQENGFFNAFGLFRNTGYSREEVDAVLFEGNALQNIDPYRYFPDPSVPVNEPQKGQFVGWMDETNVLDLLSEERLDGDLFNVKYLRHIKYKFSELGERDRSRRTVRTRLTRTHSLIDRNNVSQLHMYVKLIPRQWRLGRSEYPEKWLFTIANECLLIRAKPLGLSHDLFPVCISAPDFDGYSPVAYSRLEILSGMQTVIDWLFNCYDDRTEVLTDAGWKFIKDAKEQQLKVATVEPTTGLMHFEEPVEWYTYAYSGPMCTFLSRYCDLVVTPNHKIFGHFQSDVQSSYIRAEFLLGDLSKRDYFVPTAVLWQGEAQDYILIGDTLIDSASVVRFMAYYFMLGNCSEEEAVLVCENAQLMSHIDEMLTQLGVAAEASYHAGAKVKRWRISDIAFVTWIHRNCYDTQGNMRLPHWLKNTTGEQLHIFVHICASLVHKKSSSKVLKFACNSSELAGDVQEIAIRLGYSTHVYEQEGKYITHLDSSDMYTPLTMAFSYVSLYQGNVYCFENSTHLTVVRRDGKACVCSQSHIANVRKAINDVLIIDPYLLNVNDLKDPEPGKLVRLRRPAWGKGVKDAVHQLGITDITRANIEDVLFIIQYMQQIAGTDNPIMGSLRRGGPERLSAREFQGTTQGAISRLERVAKVIGLQGLQDIGYMFAHHTQQLMSEETYIKVAGDWPDALLRAVNAQQGRAKVTPYDILVDYDLLIRDGSIPGGNFSDVWVQLFQTIAQQPALLQSFDIVRIFKHIALNSGAKNVDDFELRPQTPAQTTVAPDEQVLREVERGNLVELLGGAQ
jgi:hypothetical protein